jgi:hypothetical protein
MIGTAARGPRPPNPPPIGGAFGGEPVVPFGGPQPLARQAVASKQRHSPPNSTAKFTAIWRSTWRSATCCKTSSCVQNTPSTANSPGVGGRVPPVRPTPPPPPVPGATARSTANWRCIWRWTWRSTTCCTTSGCVQNTPPTANSPIRLGGVTPLCYPKADLFEPGPYGQKCTLAAGSSSRRTHAVSGTSLGRSPRHLVRKFLFFRDSTSVPPANRSASPPLQVLAT